MEKKSTREKESAKERACVYVRVYEECVSGSVGWGGSFSECIKSRVFTNRLS